MTAPVELLPSLARMASQALAFRESSGRKGEAAKDAQHSDDVAVLAAVAELMEAAQMRIEWVNGSWYAVTHDGAAISNTANAEATGAQAEIDAAMKSALAKCGGGE